MSKLVEAYLKEWTAKDYNIDISKNDWVEIVANTTLDIMGTFDLYDPDEIFAKLVEGGFPEDGCGSDRYGEEFNKEDVMRVITEILYDAEMEREIEDEEVDYDNYRE